MLILRALRWVLFAAFVLGCAYLLSASPTFRACVQHEQQQTTANDNKKQQAIFVSAINIRILCAWDFIESKHDAVTAAFTVLLGFATVFLWLATRDLVSGAETASRRQLRAYLSIDPAFIEGYGIKERITFNCSVVNHGQTPAFNIYYKFNSVLMHQNLPVGWEFAPPQTEVGAGSTCFHKNTILAWFRHGAPLTPDEFKQMETTNFRLYVWGFMTYRDTFGKKRETQFNFSIGGRDFVKAMQDKRAGKKRTEPGVGYIFINGPKHGQAT